MFESKNIELFVQDVCFKAEKGSDERLCVLTLYKTPIDYELAEEVDKHIADRLFRRSGTEWKPISEFDNVRLKLQPPACSMEYKAHDQAKPKGLVPHVTFSALRAMKLFPDSDDFTLAVDATFPVNDKELIHYFISMMKKSVFCTFAEVQGELFKVPKILPSCAAKEGDKGICGQAPKYKVQGKDEYYCVDHPRAAGADATLETLSKDEQLRWAKMHADLELEENAKKKKSAAKKKKAGR